MTGATESLLRATKHMWATIISPETMCSPKPRRGVFLAIRQRSRRGAFRPLAILRAMTSRRILSHRSTRADVFCLLLLIIRRGAPRRQKSEPGRANRRRLFQCPTRDRDQGDIAKAEPRRSGGCAQDGQEGWSRCLDSHGGGRGHLGRPKSRQLARRHPFPGASRLGRTEASTGQGDPW